MDTFNRVMKTITHLPPPVLATLTVVVGLGAFTICMKLYDCAVRWLNRLKKFVLPSTRPTPQTENMSPASVEGIPFDFEHDVEYNDFKQFVERSLAC